MASMKAIEIEKQIEMIREGCKDCENCGTCAIPFAVDSILERSEKDYGVMKSIITFCGDWCPPIVMEEE